MAFRKLIRSAQDNLAQTEHSPIVLTNSEHFSLNVPTRVASSYVLIDKPPNELRAYLTTDVDDDILTHDFTFTSDQ